MRILHLINSMIVGGAETLLKDVIIGIHNHYPVFEQHLITLYGGGKMLDSISDFIKYKDLGVNYFNFILKSIELKKYIIDNKIDIVHAHLFDAMILSRLGVPKNVKLFYTYHSGLHHPRSKDYSFIRNKIDKLTYRKRHVAIYVSHTVENEVICGVNINGPSYVIYNFTSSKYQFQYNYRNNNELKLVSVGNLRIAKNHKYSIEILAALIEYPITLDIFGNGDLKNELEELIIHTGAKVKIITDSILTPEILSRYDLFFMSSFQEGMSVALIEAMTTGLPSCLSNIPSFKETAGMSAIYFEINNLPDAVSKIIFLYENKDKLKKMSMDAKNISNIFSIENHLKKVVNLYSTIS